MINPADSFGPDSLPDLSVVVPVYNEEESLEELHGRVFKVLDNLDLSWELILVNDGSEDSSPRIISEICSSDDRCRGIHLSRNFGHQAALAAGLDHARGRAVVVLDADLQDPPELIVSMVDAWKEGSEIVYARRTGRQREPRLKQLFAWGYYRALRRLTDVDIPTDTGDFCLMDRRVVEILTGMPERNRFVRGSGLGLGSSKPPLPTKDRRASQANQNILSVVPEACSERHLVSFSVSASYRDLDGPLYLSGELHSGCRFRGAEITIGFEVRGWASTTVIILFLGGVQLLTIGVIGEYLGRIYDEVKQRPLYIVGSRTGFEDTSPPVS